MPKNKNKNNKKLFFINNNNTRAEKVKFVLCLYTNIMIVSVLKTLFWLLFRMIDCSLMVVTFFLCYVKRIRTAAIKKDRKTTTRKTVIIVGGNFAGLTALWEFKRWQCNNTNTNADIILIDQRDYSEYTPGLLRLFVNPAYLFKLIQKLPDTTTINADNNNNNFNNFVRIQGTVTGIVEIAAAAAAAAATTTANNGHNNFRKILTYTDHDDDKNSNENIIKNNKGEKTIPYDYLILATGTTYVAPPISSSSARVTNNDYDYDEYGYGRRQQSTTTTLLDRNKEWHDAHTKLEEAQRILILGGGAVGVELAAEIVDHYCCYDRNHHDDDDDDSNNNNNVDNNIGGSRNNNNNEMRTLIHNNNSNNTMMKHVTIVDAQSTLVPLFPESVGKYAEEWLMRRGVHMRLSESLKSWNHRGCVLADGTVLNADIVYVCFGNQPNSKMVEISSSLQQAIKIETNKEEEIKKNDISNNNNDTFFSLTRRRNVLVKDTLQMIPTSTRINNNDTITVSSSSSSLSPWFACGDVASPPTDDEKQAFQSEMQGKIAAKNVIKLLESAAATATSAIKNPKTCHHPQPSLLKYPKDIAGCDRIPLVFVLSLGKYDGVLGLNNTTISGPFAAVVKYILEDTKVSQMRGHLLGKCIWMIGDAVTLFLSRTVFPPSSMPAAAATSKPVTTNITTASTVYNNTTNDDALFSSRQRRQLEQQLKIS